MATVSKRKWGAGEKARETWQVSWTEGGKQHKKSGFKRKAEADAFAINKEKDKLDGTSRPSGHRLTVQDAASGFLAYVDGRYKAGLISHGYNLQVQGAFRNYICKAADWTPPAKKTGGKKMHAYYFDGSLYDVKLSNIKPATVKAFEAKLMAVGMHHVTRKAMIRILHSFFEYCRDQEYIAVNPAIRIKVETPRALRGKKLRLPSRQTINDVLEASPPRLRLLIEFAATTGLRLGEMRALRWRYVNFDARSLEVTCSVNTFGHLGPPKSAAGLREVPLSRALVDRLSAHRANSSFNTDDDLVFPGRGGAYLGDHSCIHGLYQVLDELGIPRFPWHTLRHYAISAWLAANVNIKRVQVYAGHSSAGTTTNIYGHLFPEDRPDAQIDHVGADLIKGF